MKKISLIFISVFVCVIAFTSNAEAVAVNEHKGNTIAKPERSYSHNGQQEVPGASAQNNLAASISSASGKSVKEQKTGKEANTIPSKKLELNKEKALREIDRRIAGLNKLSGRINDIKRLLTTQKTELTNQINTEISKLTALQNSIQAETDLQKVKDLKQSIVNEYRVFALFIPKIHIIANADKILYTADELTNIAAKYEARLKEASDTDKAKIQPLLTDMKTYIANAKTNAQKAIDTVTPLTPEGYPQNKTSLQKGWSLLQTTRQDLAKARHSAALIMQVLVKSLKSDLKTNQEVSAAPSAAVTVIQPTDLP